MKSGRIYTVLLGILTILVPISTNAQHIKDGYYNACTASDVGILAGGLVMLGVGNLLQLGTEGLTEEEIAALDVEVISDFDDGSLNNYDLNARDLSDNVLYASVLTPFVLLADKKIRKDHRIILLMTAEVLLVNNGITDMSKGLIRRNRPLAYNPDVPLDVKLEKGTRHSFFSGHTSNVASMTFLSAHIIGQYSQSKAIKIGAWTGAVGLTALEGYLRHEAGKHFISDVVIGAGVGAIVGYMIPEMHRDRTEKAKLSFGASVNGLKLVYHID